MNNRISEAPTKKQGQALRFIHDYAKLNRRPPAEADIAEHVGISAPSAHSMTLRLEKRGLLSRTPGAARSLAVLLRPEDLPALE